MRSIGFSEYQFLEVLNGIWSVLDLTLLAWFTYYIWVQIKELEDFTWYRSFRYWSKNGLPPHVNAAISIYVFTTGDVIVRSHIWYWRHFQNLGYTAEDLSLWPLVLGGTIAAVGLLCKIRVFTVYRLGNIAWVASLFLALALVLTALLTHINF